MVKAIGLYRESGLQGAQGKDSKILDLTADELRKRGFDVLTKKPEDFSGQEIADIIFTMARGKRINNLLMERGGLVINSPATILLSINRQLAYEKVIKLGVNVPLTKRIETKDVKYSDLIIKSVLKPSKRHEFSFIVEDRESFDQGLRGYKDNDIKEIIIQKFIEGKHVKYYAVGDDVFLPDSSEVNLSSEITNGIRKQILLIEKAIGLKIFGGDFIVGKEGSFCVDINDWPSMGSIKNLAQESVAIKIAKLIQREYNIYKNRERG